MKTITMYLMVMAMLMPIAAGQSLSEGMALLPVDKIKEQAPLFYSVEADTNAGLTGKEMLSLIKLKVTVHQGRAEKITIGLSGVGEVQSVEGAELRSWALRKESDGSRFLDLYPVLPLAQPKTWQPWSGINFWDSQWRPAPLLKEVKIDGPKVFEFTITAQHDLKQGEVFNLLLPGPGEALGFSGKIELIEGQGFRVKVLELAKLSRLEGDQVRFKGVSLPKLRLKVVPLEGEVIPLELVNPMLLGKLSDDGASVSFVLRTGISVGEPESSLALLHGVALERVATGGNWHLRLAKMGDLWVHELVGDQVGEGQVELAFDVAVVRNGDWRSLNFRLPAGVVVPLRIEGLGEEVSFNKDLVVVPEYQESYWQGYLNAAGDAQLAWKDGGKEAGGTLFFSSSEVAEVRVASDLVRQTSELGFRVLQGKLESLKLQIHGEGEILRVEGDQVFGWSVNEADGERMLEVKLSRPIEGYGKLNIQARSALGAFPVKVGPMRFSPLGTLRHSGHLRVANDGAVRLEVTKATGLMQLSPEQFPGAKLGEGARQIFVYRFPSADYGYTILADQVLSEVVVSEVTIHEMGETDRRILCDLELDIREAPLREWSLEIPDGFAVATASGAVVADYSVSSVAKNGMRELKLLFSSAVAGRQLISLKLEKNQGAETGEWLLPQLRYPGAKSSRGFIGVASAPGYRLLAGPMTGLVEMSVDYFPKKMDGLQQAFRIREPKWSAAMRVEALGQSIQADVFHLYSLKEGAAYGSVVVYYFVVGAPANEWRLKIPEGLGNIDVTGQGVGRDWRSEDGVLIVPLARPSLGASMILLTFEQPMSARGGLIHPGEVRPLDVQSERGYVQVTSSLQVNATVERSEGSPLEIEASELPSEYRLFTSAPTLKAWQYTSGDVDIEMKIEWYDSAEPLGEVIDYASLESHISRDGQVATTARMFAVSKGATTLRVELPAGANENLWETRVAGKRVTARRDGNVTLISLPSQDDPNEPVEVMLRYGQKLNPGLVVLKAPKVGTAMVVANWKVTGDVGRRLVPKGGTAELLRPVQTETGFEWLASKGRMAVPFVLFLGALGLVLLRIRGIAVLGLVSLVGASVWSFMLSADALDDRRPNLGTLNYTAPAVLADDDLVLKIGNVEPWKAMLSGWGITLGVVGVGLFIWGLLGARGAEKYRRFVLGSGLALGAYGLLAQHGGAVLFFAAFGVAILLGLVLPGAARWIGGIKRKRAATAAAVLIAGIVMMPKSVAVEAAESIIQSWELSEGRLHGKLEIKVRAAELGERFLLLNAPAVLTGFDSQGLKVIKEGGRYYVVADGTGIRKGSAEFEMAVAEPRNGWMVPSGMAVVQTIYATHRDEGWEFGASNAARVMRGVEWNGLEGQVTAMHLIPGAESKVWILPRQRDASLEEVRFFAEVSDLYVPGPGVVNGRHRVAIRPAQGLVREIVLTLPVGYTVGEVADAVVGNWRFNPETRELKVAIEPAQEQGFAFSVATQKATGTLPVDLELAPLRVKDAAGAVGMLGLAFGRDAQAEEVKALGMGAVNLDDFDDRLIPHNAKAEALALLQKAYRYGAADAVLKLKVTSVAPEIRAEVKETLSLGSDRMVLAVDLVARITRAGVFKLLLELPNGLEVESVTGSSLAHWSEVKDDKQRVLSLTLLGRSIGEQIFAITLSGPSPGSQDSWEVPKLVLREATRQRGTLTVVPERGLQVRAVTRKNVSQLDPRDAGVPRPGALAFRLLQSDWSLALAIKELEPWVTAQALQHVSIREGQVLTRTRVRYRIENAARKSMRLRLPGLDEASAATVRATGPAVGDFVPVEGENGVWEVRFQRSVAGETEVDIEYQQQKGEGSVAVVPIELIDVRQTSYYVAVKTGGRQEGRVEKSPRGWQKIDWTAVPTTLRSEPSHSAPEFVYRVAESEGNLQIGLQRHVLAGSEALRVLNGHLTTLLSMEGGAITTVRFSIDVREKASLRLELPGGAVPINLLVNGEGVPLVMSEGKWLFYVSKSPTGEGPASLAFSYSLQAARPGSLQGPKLDLPLENLIWDVYVPDGWRLGGSRGNFQFVKQQDIGAVGLEEYQATVTQRSSQGKAAAVAELDEGYALLRAGDQEQAGKVLGKAARNGFLDEASNEDARVQFRNLKMQQAVLGLNTRRQRNYLDNRFSNKNKPNQQFEQAAQENPILQGSYNWDPQKFDSLMVGNSVEDTSTMRGIAGRIVEQQMEIEAAPKSLDVGVLGQGRMLRFSRSLQVKGDEVMSLDLKLERDRPSGWLYGSVIGLLAACVLMVGVMPQKAKD